MSICIPFLVMYVSGALTTGSGRTFDENVAEFERVSTQLSVNGIAAYNPALVSIDGGTQEDYMQYYENCILPQCDAMYMRDGWQQSTGARREHAWAVDHRMPIYYEREGGE